MKTIRVVAAVIQRDGRYFATQRGYGEFKDWWEFPGGKIEEGETPEEALKREIREELQTEIGIDRALVTIECDYPDFHLQLQCFLCHLVKGKLQLLEAEDARWLDPEHLDTVYWLPADQKVVEVLNDEVSGNAPQNG